MGEDAHAFLRLVGQPARDLPIVGRRKHADGGMRDALQEEVGRAQHRAGEEPPLHGTVEDAVGDREQAHGLVMGHERPEGDGGLAGWRRAGV